MTLVYILLILILATLAYFIYQQKQIKAVEPDLSKAIDTLVKLSNEKLDDKTKQISVDLSNKKDAIEKMVRDISENLTKVEKERVGGNVVEPRALGPIHQA